jgi:predicted outer membrane repeat protein
MKKNIRTSFRLVASLLAVVALASLMACQEPVLVARKKADDQTTTEPGQTPESELGQLPPFALVYDGKNTASLSPFTTLASSARSLGGYDRQGIILLDGNTLTYFQWVFMDEAADGDIYAFDFADNSISTAMNLNAAVEPGHTYHVLLLAGYKPSSGDPTLLASAYTRFTATGGAASQLNLTLIPVVVDVKFSGGSDGARQPGRLAKTVGLDKEQTYTLEYFIGSSDKAVATDDALRQATNDGLWPLKLASAEVRQNDTWRYKYSQEVDPVTHLRETLTSYVPGVLDTVEVPLNSAFGTNLAWVKWGTDREEGLNDLSVNKSLSTTGRGKYGLTTPQTLTEGTVWFHLEYVPFAIFNDAMWQAVSGNRLPARPVWVIRNGLTDTKQVAPTTWTPGMAYNGTDGGIAIGVVDPASPFTAGLYEDNNPWPVPGTSGKTSVEIQQWVNDYCAAQTPAITTRTLAGIHAAKSGAYRLLPRRYYAAPLSGSEPVGGLTGIAAKNGVSWLDASSNIQKLVDLAAANVQLSEQPVEIWAAAGTYTTVDSSGGNITGTVISIGSTNQHLSIYGGFKGTENAAIGSLPADRASWFNSYTTLALGNRYGTVKEAARKTTLDGGGNGRVVAVDGAADFVLDGFTITGGTNNGIRITNAPETARFTNLEVTGNSSSGSSAGGLWISGGAPRVDNVSVTSNTGIGGMYINNGAASLITNALFSGNVTSAMGGGIFIFGPTVRLENIVVTGNKSTSAGGGIYMHGTVQVIVNALVIGNTCGVSAGSTDPYGLGGGGIYVGADWYGQGAVIVNALVSGNRMTVSTPPVERYYQVGGGGIKVSNEGRLTLINSTVSGNYAVFSSDPGNPRGGGIMLTEGPTDTRPSTLNLYNSIVVGNTGQSGDDDLTIVPNNNGTTPVYTANNSLVGGRSKAEMDATSGGGANVDGASYGATQWDLQTKLNNGFFVKFPAIPTAANTGDTGYNAGAWDFRLGLGTPPGVVDGGDAAHYSGAYGVSVTTDVAGAPRAQAGGPDMGAYESTLTGAPIPTYAVFNAKPQSASPYGHLTVNGAAQIMIMAGAEVTIEAMPVSGYGVGTITCRTASGVPVPVTAISTTGGKFTMPAEDVTVDATFTTTGGWTVGWSTP